MLRQSAALSSVASLQNNILDALRRDEIVRAIVPEPYPATPNSAYKSIWYCRRLGCKVASVHAEQFVLPTRAGDTQGLATDPYSLDHIGEFTRVCDEYVMASDVNQKNIYNMTIVKTDPYSPQRFALAFDSETSPVHMRYEFRVINGVAEMVEHEVIILGEPGRGCCSMCTLYISGYLVNQHIVTHSDNPVDISTEYDTHGRRAYWIVNGAVGQIWVNLCGCDYMLDTNTYMDGQSRIVHHDNAGVCTIYVRDPQTRRWELAICFSK